jgi:3-oxoacyl-(acyl-carrier-protein) synthase
MSSHAIALTGAGVVTPLGDDLTRIMEALREGQAAPTTASGSLVIPTFDANHYANVRGMRVYSRATQLGIAAGALAMAQAKLSESGFSSDQLGLVMGSSFGHLDTLAEYDFGLVTKGMERTNPALMPLAIGSAPGAATALAFQLRGCSVTLSQGAASGLDGIALAARLVARGRLRACLVVGAFAPGGLVDGEVKASERRVEPRNARVFDASSRGVMLAEAGAAVIVESLASARERGAEVLGIVRSHAGAFASAAQELPNALAAATSRAMEQAALGDEHIALISSGASGLPAEDAAHALAATVAAQGHASIEQQPWVIAPKANLGESHDAAGILQVLIGLSALRSGTAPGVVGLETPRVGGPRYALKTCSIEQGALLATGTTGTGATSALVLSTSIG